MIIASLVVTGPFIALFMLVYRYFITKLIEKLDYMDENTALSILGFITEAEHQMKIVILVGTVVILFGNILVFLYLSHAIAGPIEKLKGHLKRKANNEKTGPFITRSSDFFPELPPLVNKAFGDSFATEGIKES
jgi:hypothetical protein